MLCLSWRFHCFFKWCLSLSEHLINSCRKKHFLATCRLQWYTDFSNHLPRKCLHIHLEEAATLMWLMFYSKLIPKSQGSGVYFVVFAATFASHLMFFFSITSRRTGKTDESYLCRRRTNLVAEWNSCLMPRETDSRLPGLWGFEVSVE